MKLNILAVSSGPHELMRNFGVKQTVLNLDLSGHWFKWSWDSHS